MTEEKIYKDGQWVKDDFKGEAWAFGEVGGGIRLASTEDEANSLIGYYCRDLKNPKVWLYRR